MVKLIASDLDGTIIGRENSICETNFTAINAIHKKNIPFAICSGKTYPIIKSMCSDFNATYGIFGNGNQIINLKTGEEIYKKLLTLEEIENCYNIAKKYKMHVHVYTDTQVITEKLMYMDLRNYKLQETKYYDNDLQFKTVKNVLNYIIKHNASVLKLVVSSDANISFAENELKSSTDLTICKISKYGEYKDTIINKEYSYLDITPNNISKKQAVEFLSNYLNVSNDEVMTIGDNLNDLEMVESSGIGVAVANAYDELKKVAKYTTTSSVEDGGFAEAVYKFIEI